MDLLIRGGGFSNKGAEAMMLTAQRELSARIPDINFLLRLPPRQAESARSYGFFPIVIQKSRFKKGFSLLSQVLSRSAVRGAVFKNILGALELADVKRIDGVIDVSGFGYSDVWGAEPAERSLVWIKYCHKKDIPYVYMPQAWGPFSKPEVARTVIKMCQFSSLLYARDEESFIHLTGLSDKEKDKIRLAPDIVFGFRGAEKEVGSSLLKNMGIETGKYPLVGLAPNLRVYERMAGEGVDSTYIQLLVKIARYCMQEWNAAIVLIPHEIALGHSLQKDDRFLCSLIYDGISNHGKAANITEDLPARSIYSVISNMDLLIGSRFHSLVFALASEVPAVAMGWAHKYEELMRSVGLEKFFMDLRNLDEEVLLELIGEAWSTREQSRALLAERIPQIAQKVDVVFDEVAEIFRRVKTN